MTGVGVVRVREAIQTLRNRLAFLQSKRRSMPPGDLGHVTDLIDAREEARAIVDELEEAKSVLADIEAEIKQLKAE